MFRDVINCVCNAVAVDYKDVDKFVTLPSISFIVSTTFMSASAQ